MALWIHKYFKGWVYHMHLVFTMIPKCCNLVDNHIKENWQRTVNWMESLPSHSVNTILKVILKYFRYKIYCWIVGITIGRWYCINVHRLDISHKTTPPVTLKQNNFLVKFICCLFGIFDDIVKQLLQWWFACTRFGNGIYIITVTATASASLVSSASNRNTWLTGTTLQRLNVQFQTTFT